MPSPSTSPAAFRSDAVLAPALIVLSDGRPWAANQAASALMAEDPGFWEGVWPQIARGALPPEFAPSDPVPRRLEWERMATAGGELLVGRDVTMEQGLREALAESRQRFRDLVEVSSDFAWETDADGAFVFVAGMALGHGPDDLLGRNAEAVFGPDAGALFRASRPMRDVEFVLRRHNGGTAIIRAGAVPLPGGGARGVCRDVTTERALESELARARTRERLLSHAIGALRDEIDPARGMQLAAEALVRSVAASGCRIFHCRNGGATPVATVGAATAEGGPALEVETRMGALPNGRIELWRHAGDPGFDGDDRAIAQAVAAQVAMALAQWDHQIELRHLSERDGLTGLFNRRAFFDHAAQRLRTATGTAALLYVDLDNFKQINDSRGHATGDALLQRVAARLESVCRLPTDIAARVGGDEFILLLTDVAPGEAETAAKSFLGQVRGLHDAGAGAQPLGASIGIAFSPPSARRTMDDLIGQADAAMYRAKHGGKHAVVLADEGEPA